MKPGDTLHTDKTMFLHLTRLPDWQDGTLPWPPPVPAMELSKAEPIRSPMDRKARIPRGKQHEPAL
jgi:hypothetical protein